MASDVVDLTGASSDEESEVSAIYNGKVHKPDLSFWQAQNQVIKVQGSRDRKRTWKAVYETSHPSVLKRVKTENNSRNPKSHPTVNHNTTSRLPSELSSTNFRASFAKQQQLSVGSRGLQTSPRVSSINDQTQKKAVNPIEGRKGTSSLAGTSTSLHLVGRTDITCPLLSRNLDVQTLDNQILVRKDIASARPELISLNQSERASTIASPAPDSAKLSVISVSDETDELSNDKIDFTLSRSGSKVTNCDTAGEVMNALSSTRKITNKDVSAWSHLANNSEAEPDMPTRGLNNDHSKPSTGLNSTSARDALKNQRQNHRIIEHQPKPETSKTRELIDKLNRVSLIAGAPYVKEEDDLLIHLKEDLNLRWVDIGKYFSRSGWRTLQVHYCTHLAKSGRPIGAGTSGGKELPRNDSSTHAEPKTIILLNPSTRRKRQTRADNDSAFNYYDEIRDYGSSDNAQHGLDETDPHPIPVHIQQEPHKRYLDSQNKGIKQLGHISTKNFTNTSVVPKESKLPRVSTNLVDLQLERYIAASAAGIDCIELPTPPGPSGLEREQLWKCKEQRRGTKRRSRKERRRSIPSSMTDESLQEHQITTTGIQPSTASSDTCLASQEYERCKLIRPTKARRIYLSGSLFVENNEQSRRAQPHARSNRSEKPLSSLLRFRELGLLQKPNLQVQSAFNEYSPTLLAKGASGDINTVAWSPGGNLFAVGAAALTDDHNMQYNRPNNLLVGDADGKKLMELPNHVIARRPTTGINASSEMQASQEPYLFTTISSISFTSDGKYMLSAGFDKHVRIWNTVENARGVEYWTEIFCNSRVDVMEANSLGVFAIGMQTETDNIWVLPKNLEESIDNNMLTKFSSPLATQRKNITVEPSCIRWGVGSYAQNFLIAGFSARNDTDPQGEICLWDVNVEKQAGTTRCSRAVFDVKWSPTDPGRIAVACKPSGDVNKGTKSVVKIFDSRIFPDSTIRVNRQRTIELECDALDVNDLTLSPRDPNVLTLSCTNGLVYVWDLRNHSEPLHRLEHGRPLLELLDDYTCEEQDTGVRFTSWDQFGRKLYTGSSDGLVALWDPYRAPKDAFEKEIVRMDSGIMAGAFSEDHHRLLLGDVQGSTMLLEKDVAPSTERHACTQTHIIEATAEKAKLKQAYKTESNDVESGIAAARTLLATGQIDLRPCGNMPIRQAVQGENYMGPYSHDLDVEKLRQNAEILQRQFHANEPQGNAVQRSRVFVDEDVLDAEHWKN